MSHEQTTHVPTDKAAGVFLDYLDGRRVPSQVAEVMLAENAEDLAGLTESDDRVRVAAVRDLARRARREGKRNAIRAELDRRYGKDRPRGGTNGHSLLDQPANQTEAERRFKKPGRS